MDDRTAKHLDDPVEQHFKRALEALRGARERESVLRQAQRTALEIAAERFKVRAAEAGNDPFDPSRPLVSVRLSKTDRGDSLRIDAADCFICLELHDDVGGQLFILTEPKDLYERIVQDRNPLDIVAFGPTAAVRFFKDGALAGTPVTIEELLNTFVAAVSWKIQARTALQMRDRPS